MARLVVILAPTPDLAAQAAFNVGLLAGEWIYPEVEQQLRGKVVTQVIYVSGWALRDYDPILLRQIETRVRLKGIPTFEQPTTAQWLGAASPFADFTNTTVRVRDPKRGLLARLRRWVRRA